jgi:hypothetical protein
MIRWLMGLLLVPALAAAQAKPPKLDSLLVTVPVPKAEAAERVVAALEAVGLAVTTSTPSVVESDQGETLDQLTGANRHRVVRATLLPAGDTTRVLLRGVEEILRRGRTEKRKAIDNRADGNGGKVWAKMVAAARQLDSASVPAFADRPPDPPRKAPTMGRP